jgi:hypothetical protein
MSLKSTEIPDSPMEPMTNATNFEDSGEQIMKQKHSSTTPKCIVVGKISAGTWVAELVPFLGCAAYGQTRRAAIAGVKQSALKAIRRAQTRTAWWHEPGKRKRKPAVHR